MSLGILAGPESAEAATTSHLQSPTVTFSTFGLHTVTLTACRWIGCTSKTVNITVLNPNPTIQSASSEVLTAEVGQMVRLSGAGTGKPPLAYSWSVFLGVNVVAAGIPGSAAWWDTRGLAPGLYTIILHLSNDVGNADSLPVPVALIPAQPLDFYTLAPCRILDTRETSAPLSGGIASTYDATLGTCGVPANARAIVVNVTAVNATAAGSMVLFPGNYPTPSTTSVNFSAGQARAEFAVVMLATTGTPSFAAEVSLASPGTVDLIVDVSGYFAVGPVEP